MDPRSSLVEETFDALYGLEVLSCDEEEIRAQVPVRDELKQVAGLVHGGLYASMAESMASRATGLAVGRDGRIATGLGSATSVVRSITKGTVHAVARRRHRGRTTWVWDVDFTDDAGRLCATARMTMAVREPPED